MAAAVLEVVFGGDAGDEFPERSQRKKHHAKAHFTYMHMHVHVSILFVCASTPNYRIVGNFRQGKISPKLEV